MIDEIWKKWKGTIYVSNMGRVMDRSRRPGLLYPRYDKQKYSIIEFEDGILNVHMAVAALFVRNPSAYKFVEHRDGNKLNNRSSNLEWVQRKRAKKSN